MSDVYVGEALRLFLGWGYIQSRPEQGFVLHCLPRKPQSERSRAASNQLESLTCRTCDTEKPSDLFWTGDIIKSTPERRPCLHHMRAIAPKRAQETNKNRAPKHGRKMYNDGRGQRNYARSCKRRPMKSQLAHTVWNLKLW